MTIFSSTRNNALCRREQIEASLFVLIGFGVLGLSALRAWNTGITYDEAFTYQHYSLITHNNPYPWLQIGFLNNHLLNSILITYTSIFNSYNEFLIRLPNILFHAFYIIIAIKFSFRVRQKYVLFFLLIGNYYLNEFFGLARGYGISASLVLFSLYLIAQNEDNNHIRYFLLSYTTLLFATYANFMALYLLTAFTVDSVFRFKMEFKHSLTKHRLSFLLLISCTLVAVYVFYLQSLGPVPYGGHGPSGSQESFTKTFPWGFISMYYPFGYNHIVAALLFLFLLIAAVPPLIQQPNRISSIRLFVLTLVIVFLTSKILGHDFPRGRVLIPLFPLAVLAVIEIIDYYPVILKKFLDHKIISSGKYLFISIVTAIFLLQINIQSTREWNDNYVIKESFTSFLKTGEQSFPEMFQGVNNPVFQFYLNKYGLSLTGTKE